MSGRKNPKRPLDAVVRQACIQGSSDANARKKELIKCRAAMAKKMKEVANLPGASREVAFHLLFAYSRSSTRMSEKARISSSVRVAKGKLSQSSLQQEEAVNFGIQSATTALQKARQKQSQLP